MGNGNTKLDLDPDSIVTAIVDPSKRRNLAQLVDPNQTLTFDGASIKPLHLAIACENYEAVKQLVSNKTTDVNSRFNGIPCLSMAAATSTLQIVKELLMRKDLNVNAVFGASHVTALMAAVSQKSDTRLETDRAQVVEAIVSDPRCEAAIMDRDNYTALSYAAHLGFALVAKTLLQNGRAARYDMEELMGDYNISVRTGHDEVRDLILESLTSEQRALFLSQLNSQRGAVMQHEIADNVSVLLNHSDALLGAVVAGANSSSAIDSRRHVDHFGKDIKIGSVVRLPSEREASIEGLKHLQRGHGGWNEESNFLLGRPCIIRAFDRDGDVVVDYLFMQSQSQSVQLLLNPRAVILVSKDDGTISTDRNGNAIKKGDIVMILDDEEQFKAVQQDLFGDRGWRDTMRKLLGKHGKIMFLDVEGGVNLTIGINVLRVSPKAIAVIDSVKRDDGQVVTVGDSVTLTSSREDFERLQTPEFGGWNAKMERFLGLTAVVHSIQCNVFFETDNPKCLVQLNVTGEYNATCWINPEAIVDIVKRDSLLDSGSPIVVVHVDSAGLPVSMGSAVTLVNDVELVQKLQAGRKGWSDKLFSVFAKLPSLVTSVKQDGDIEVAGLAFITGDQNTVITVNPKAVILRSKDDHTVLDHDETVIVKGDTVNLLEDEAKFRSLQEGHSVWRDDVRLFLGQPIVILFFDRDGDIVAKLGEIGLAYINPKATKKVEKVSSLREREASVQVAGSVVAADAEYRTDTAAGVSCGD